MNLGVIIVSYNVRELLHACLTSLFADIARTPDLDAQVLVVDNASADGSADMVAEAFPQVELIASEENLGFAGGNNQGLRSLGFGVTRAFGSLSPMRCCCSTPTPKSSRAHWPP